MTPEPGIYYDVPKTTYFSWPYPSFSSLKPFLDMPPARVKAEMDIPVDPTTAMDEGSFFDALHFEPGVLEVEFVAKPADAPKKQGAKNMAWWADFEATNKGKAVISQQMWDDAEAIRDAVWQHPVANMLRGAKKQVSVVWDCPDTGIRIKGRIDAITQWRGWSTVIDLKTVGDSADAANFGRRACNLHYPMQAWMYLQGLNTVAPFERKWLWIVIERKRPYCVAVYEADADALEIGRLDYNRAINDYLVCTTNDRWPGYPVEPQPLQVPRWAMPKEMIDG